ncbi:MAG: hypothetical protein GY795_50885 [Desulfobacterales bacterium]|nr:hypothetical protein [Desulfobacterales bacterium]
MYNRRKSLQVYWLIMLLLSFVFYGIGNAENCSSEPGDTQITYGDIIECSFDYDGDLDLFRLAGKKGDRIYLAILGESSISYSIIKPDGTTFNSGICSNCKTDITLDEKTVYTIKVTSYAFFPDKGDYRIELTCLGGDCSPYNPVNLCEFDSDNDGVSDIRDKCSDTLKGSCVDNNGCASCTEGLYTQEQVNQIVSNILTWGDSDGDGKIGLQEAVNALQITTGIKSK